MNNRSRISIAVIFICAASLAAANVFWKRADSPQRDSNETAASNETALTGDPVINGKYSKPSDAVIREKLSELQYRVTQEEGTESPFKNEFWDNKKDGIYVDIVSGEPLFSSKSKFKSGTGWPSFFKPLVAGNIVERDDFSLFSKRTEVRSKYGDSHLGHVFPDGPEPTGLRYCINSASLRFVPVDSLEEEGYGEFKSSFE